MKAFLVMGRTLKAAYEELFMVVFLSVAWWVGMAVSLVICYAIYVLIQVMLVRDPGAGFDPAAQLALWIVLIGTITWLTGGPVTAGIHLVANRLANYKRVDNSFFWEGTRTHVRRSWLLYLINLLLPVIIAFSIVFYINTGGWLRMLGFVCIWLLLFVLMVGQYTFPLFWQQEDPDLRLALRNAALLSMQRPLYTLLILLFQAVIIGISAAIALPVILLMPGLIALSANFALVGILQDLGLAPQPPVVSSR
jgi:hypothetical protein